MGRFKLVGDTLLLSPTILVDDMKDNDTRTSTVEVQIQIWKLNQDALFVRNRPKMGTWSLVKDQHQNTIITPSGCAAMNMTLLKKKPQMIFLGIKINIFLNNRSKFWVGHVDKMSFLQRKKLSNVRKYKKLRYSPKI